VLVEVRERDPPDAVDLERALSVAPRATSRSASASQSGEVRSGWKLFVPCLLSATLTNSQVTRVGFSSRAPMAA
jgi:hypothetical protein